MNVYDRFIKPLRYRLLSALDLEVRLQEDSYVGTYHGEISRFEEHLSALGFRRNPFAFLKRHDEYGRSEASWVKRKTLFSDLQLHVTLQSCHSGSKTRVYAHREDNFFRHPVGHLRGRNLDLRGGKRLLRELLNEQVNEEKITYHIK
jgi:hypothetical protein